MFKSIRFLKTVNQKKRGNEGSRGGTAVIMLTSHQCGADSNPGPGVISRLSLLLVLVLAPREFFSGFSSFPPSTRINNSNLIGNSRAIGLSVV